MRPLKANHEANSLQKTKQQINIRQFAPMQEIAENIDEMLDRLYRCNNTNEILNIKRRICSQALCMQGIIEVDSMMNSSPYINFKNHLMNIKQNPKYPNHVKDCIENILPILNSKTYGLETLKPVKCFPSQNLLKNFFQSQKHVEDRLELAETDPQTYLRTSKLNIIDNQKPNQNNPRGRGDKSNSNARRCYSSVQYNSK